MSLTRVQNRVIKNRKTVMKLILETNQKEVDTVKLALTKFINEAKNQPATLQKWGLNQVDLARIERFRDTLNVAPLTE
ncbi:hypothetical protein ACO2Q8_20230 [Larkinella sp. VNQ87]|uniref:hypothetical protein n=1 Tax=Larkinella sp. VNQ87 TaxID=3400921 RepID=UPI003C03A3CB